ncbi:MAG: class I SAM-dependent methyltransferase [Xanthomonadales bacterium]|nr:class I SAM-dependent methyltransferase [Xanthomonadales bacterium]MCB1640654.1 class I SAM-dependent methyltransferase [Xanthomonadales bacterium]
MTYNALLAQENASLSLEHWEIYYRRGALATGPCGRDGLYDQQIRQAWAAFFGTLPAAARVLDIGTGNGVVPLLAKQVAAAKGAQWEIHGTDLAQIDPPRHVADGARRFEGIRFHPGVANERLPFEDQQFDAVTGHYALEYGDVPATLAEVLRVLKPGADAEFILHSPDAVLTHSAVVSLREAELVLKETRLYRRLHKLVCMDGATNSATERARQELVLAIRTVKQALSQATAPGAGQTLRVALDATQQLLAARREGNPHQVGREVDRAEKELRLGARRLSDLVNHACSEADMARIQQDAASAGFTLIECTQQLHLPGVVAGWHLLLHKP